MKFSLLLLISFFLTTGIHAQKIRIKNDLVLIDGISCLRINDKDPNNVTFYDMEGKEIIFLKTVLNPGSGTTYTKVIFLESGMSFSSASILFTKKLLIKKLLQDGILTDGKIVHEKISTFILKYDENAEWK